MGLAVRNRLVDQLRVLGLLGGGEDEGRVGGGILRLVLVDGGEVAGVADDDLFNWKCHGSARVLSFVFSDLINPLGGAQSSSLSPVV